MTFEEMQEILARVAKQQEQFAHDSKFLLDAQAQSDVRQAAMDATMKDIAENVNKLAAMQIEQNETWNKTHAEQGERLDHFIVVLEKYITESREKRNGAT